MADDKTSSYSGRRLDLLPHIPWDSLSNSQIHNIHQLVEALEELRPFDDTDISKCRFSDMIYRKYGVLSAMLVAWAMLSDNDRDTFWADTVCKEFPDTPADWRNPRKHKSPPGEPLLGQGELAFTSTHYSVQSSRRARKVRPRW